jgi:hypothetical protein
VDLDADFADLDLEQLHQRTYLVRSYRDGDQLRIRGVVQDLKPAGLYVADDDEPLEMHHMVVDLLVDVPALVIVDAHVVMETHPHDECVRIVDHYAELVGLSIARGFTHKVRELFGGPRGCTHTTALLQAMAPVAVQSMWSLRLDQGSEQPVAEPRVLTKEERAAMSLVNLNTCHVWAEDSDYVAAIRETGEVPMPKPLVKRMQERGVSSPTWQVD